MCRENEFVMLSALQHYLFCSRQCALIHLENVWSDNYLTTAGNVLHTRVDRGGAETRKTIHLATSLRLISKKLGLTGVADMVEFHKCDQSLNATGKIVATTLSGRRGWWRPFPVEYKHGTPQAQYADEVQLCAQALCLEEMLNVEIECGALFYGTSRRRVNVVFDEALRQRTAEAARGVHDLIVSGITPRAELKKSCRACSLLGTCFPDHVSGRSDVKQWIAAKLRGEGI